MKGRDWGSVGKISRVCLVREVRLSRVCWREGRPTMKGYDWGWVCWQAIKGMFDGVVRPSRVLC